MNKMKDSANACLSGLCLAGRMLYALLTEGWTVLCFWPAVMLGLLDMAREMLVLMAGEDAGQEGAVLSVYVQVLLCTVLFRLVVKVYQHYILDFSAGAARSAEMRSPEKGKCNE